MGFGDKVTSVITEHNKAVIAVLLLVTLLIGSGASQVTQSSSLNQFQSETEQANALQKIEQNFSTGRENTTTVQLIVRSEGDNGNVLDKQSLVNILELQKSYRSNKKINKTLNGTNTVFGISNIVAITAIKQRKGRQLQKKAAELQAKRDRLNQTKAQLTNLLDRTRAAQAKLGKLNASLAADKISKQEYRKRSSAVKKEFEKINQKAKSTLSDEQYRTYAALQNRVRTLQSQLNQLNASLAAGDISRTEYMTKAGELKTKFRQTYKGVQKVLAPQIKEIQKLGKELSQEKKALESSNPSLQTQIDTLKSMNESQIDNALKAIFANKSNGQSSQAFALMPTNYKPKENPTYSNATMVILFQETKQDTVQGMASDRIVNTQKEMQSIAKNTIDDEVLVFGSGIISDEIDRSMSESLMIVGPMALLFVIITLIIAYRDLLDIILGLLGIFLVLMWTFGFMGWMRIQFNQIFIAVPVLLIGLSIDYAIHVFMRHREERNDGDGDSVRKSMAVALTGVGIALVWVTATTVIGFLSNLVSPLPPIQEFGIVSSFGIVSALIIFGALIPAIKVGLDSFLENRGLDRKKGAFGTGGGRFSKVLSGGAIAARKAPWVVILIAVLISLGGAYGATQVDTSFEQEDFLAEDPPGWMKDLPEPFKPGNYSAKQNIKYVNNNFIREDTKAQILIEGDITKPETLETIDEAHNRIADTGIAVILSNDEPDIRSPLASMRSVTNESFVAAFNKADTNGNGVPDKNIESLYDKFFEVAPQQANSVLYKEDGEYQAARIVVSAKSGEGITSADIKEEMAGVASWISGQGYDAVETGQPIVFEIVSNQLLETVIQSLILTLVAVFLFLMVVYRIFEGSATLGAFTLLPMMMSVSWILGTMYLLGMPFNVLTGMITSLTVGLGIAYTIHVSERYNLELKRNGSAWEAMQKTVTGTGGALLGSAATTVGGFGVLAFAIIPSLKQFGIITGLTIIYAFIASVFLLPSLLMVWTRYFGEKSIEPDSETQEEAAKAGAD